MDSEFDIIETKTTLVRRICMALTTLVLVVLLGMSGEAIALVSQSIDLDPGTPEKTISLTEEQAVVRIAPRSKAQAKTEEDRTSAGQHVLCLAPSAIAAAGQVAVALPNGGRPSAVHPTGPPRGRV